MKTYYEKENVKLFQYIFLYWRHGENSLHILISPVLFHLLKHVTRKFKVTYVAHIVSTGHCYLDIYLHFLSFKTALAFESLTYLELIFIFGSEVRTQFQLLTYEWPIVSISTDWTVHFLSHWFDMSSLSYTQAAYSTQSVSILCITSLVKLSTQVLYHLNYYSFKLSPSWYL